MARAFLLIRLTLVLVGGLVAAGAASSATTPAADGARKAGNSFTMITSTATPPSRVVAPSGGASIAPKGVVSNPYNVPLMQNAGLLRSTR